MSSTTSNTRSNYCKLYIVRHGETEWNVQKRIQGQTDSLLTSIGEYQAKTLAEKFKTIKFDAAFSSDLLRAKRTADIIAAEHKLIVESKEALRERYFGRLEGKLWREHEHEMKYLFGEYIDEQEKALLEGKIDKTLIEEVETSDAMIARFIRFLREISIAYAGKTVLVVCHGGIMMHFIEHIGYMKNIYVGNTAFMKMESDGVDFFVKETDGISEWNKA